LRGNLICVYGLKIDAQEILTVVERDGLNSLVYRRNYNYHAQLSGIGNIRRYEGPDLDPHPSAPPHHREHHVHLLDPPGKPDGEVERIDILEEEETPTLPEFIREMIAWVPPNVDEIHPITLKRIVGIRSIG
jgi:hypothetical protein